MATERNMYSVLANLMGIDRLSHPQIIRGKRRGLSETYLHNIASISRRERSSSDVGEDDSYMDVDGHLKSENVIDISEGISVSEHHNSLGRNDNSILTVNGICLSVKTELEEIRFSPEDQRCKQLKGFDMQGNTKLCSPLGHLTVIGSSSVSTGKVQELGHAGKEAYLDVTSLSSSSSLSGRGKRKNILSVRKKGQISQGSRTKSLYNNGMEPGEIAKQITNQVMHSVWNSFIDVSRSGPRNDEIFANEHEETMHPSPYLFVPENKYESSSCDPIKSTSLKECSPEVRTSYGSKTHDRGTCGGNSIPRSNGRVLRTPFATSVANGWQVGAARYLSKPTLFPSAWVPISRRRHLTLDRSWCLRPGEMGNIQGDDDSRKDNSHHEDVISTSEHNGPSLDSEKCVLNQEASLIHNDFTTVEEKNLLKEISTAGESFGNRSAVIPNETADKHLQEEVSQEDSGGSTPSNCSFSPLSVNISDKENKKKEKSIKFQKEHLSSELNTCILLENRESVLQDLCLKHQLKNDAAEPGSPVSSLEGPEACRLHPNLILEFKDNSSLLGCLENGVHGFDEPVMMISSGDLDEDGSSDHRDFSYFVDVLVEAGFHLENEGEKWSSRGYVFELLEKKYSKQISWARSERRLLFDRINLRLLEISRPFIGMYPWKKPIVKRLLVKDLWASLVRQAEESKRETSDKVYRREIEWLELEEDIDSILRQVESFLVDELIEDMFL